MKKIKNLKEENRKMHAKSEVYNTPPRWRISKKRIESHP